MGLLDGRAWFRSGLLAGAMGLVCGVQAYALSPQTYVPIFAYDETANVLYFIDKANNPVPVCTDGSGACTPVNPFVLTGAPPCIQFIDGSTPAQLCEDASGNLSMQPNQSGGIVYIVPYSVAGFNGVLSAVIANNYIGANAVTRLTVTGGTAGAFAWLETSDNNGAPSFNINAGSGTSGTYSLSQGGTGNMLATVNGKTGWNFDQYGHMTLGAGAPTLTGCGGGSPTISGTDSVGVVQPGTGTPTSCQVNFGHAFTVAPKCFYTVNSTAGAFSISLVETTGNVIFYVNSGGVPNFNYLCIGQ